LVLEIIEKAKYKLDSSLHLLANYLNPYYYRDKAARKGTTAKIAVMHCINVFHTEQYYIQHKIRARNL